MWEIIVSKLLGSFSETVAEVYIEKKRLKHEAEMEKLRGKIAWEAALTRRAEASEGRDHEWEIARIKDAGWKDEWVLGLLSIPLVGSFIPKMAPYVHDGFAVLGTTPEWYRWMILIIFPAIFGIRVWRRDINPLKA